MVLGIGEGSIEIATERQAYKPGETVRGQVRLTLSAPKKAKQLRLSFYGERKHTTSTHKHTRGHGHRHTSTERIYEQAITIDGEKEYPAGTTSYPFELRLPDMPGPSTAGEGLLGSIAGYIANMSDPVKNYSWYLDASLDVPMSFDIGKNMRLNLTR